MLRSDLLTWAQPLADPACDVLVIGGGATGLGVAVQAALEGRRVALVEARDFACGTSSRSTKLLHGGVRYLAQGRVRLVREALHERAVVLGLAPHLAQPLPFVVAEKNWFSWALTTIGLTLYQGLAGRLSLGPTQALGRAALRRLLPTLPAVAAGVRYWDGQFDDARLAVALARTAQAAGAALRNHTRVVGLRAEGQTWAVTLEDALSGEVSTVHARSVVNAAGVWVDALRQLALSDTNPRHAAAAQTADSRVRPLVRPSQGVHLVVSRQTLPITQAVLVPRTSDGRVLFAVPWLGSVVIGTTDTPRDDAPLEPRPMAEEMAFLFDETRRELGVALTPADVRSVWVGLRPLVDAGAGQGGRPAASNTAAISREHLITREADGFVTVTGGKWTTYRAMAEEVMAELVNAGDLAAPVQAAHTESHRLWGAPPAGAAAVSLQDAPGLHLLGTAAAAVAALPGHDLPLGLGLTESLVRYAARHEWAVTVEDMLARRWRALFLDARAAEAMAPRVAEVLREETGMDPQLAPFLALCKQYRVPAEQNLAGPAALFA
jgi:glycerol-3-phosphate dehydrogenase